MREDKGDLAGAIADYSKAIELFGKAGKINPGLARAYLRRGAVYMLQGNNVAAQQDFAECLRLNQGMKPVLEQRIKEVHRRRATSR